MNEKLLKLFGAFSILALALCLTLVIFVIENSGGIDRLEGKVGILEHHVNKMAKTWEAEYICLGEDYYLCVASTSKSCEDGPIVPLEDYVVITGSEWCGGGGTVTGASSDYISSKGYKPGPFYVVSDGGQVYLDDMKGNRFKEGAYMFIDSRGDMRWAHGDYEKVDADTYIETLDSLRAIYGDNGRRYFE